MREPRMPVYISPNVVPRRKPARMPEPTRVEKAIAATSDVARSTITHRLIAALPIVMVNIVAVSGQYAWAHDHLASWHWYGNAVFALALESIALTLGYHAHLAECENDAAFGLKAASYGFGLLVGVLNFSHYAHGWKPNAVALVAGMMSSISPWLWHVYTRRISRNKLLTNGLIDRPSIRLGMTRWVWHPIRSWQVTYAATWNGDVHVGRAIDRYNREANARLADKAARKAARQINAELQGITS
jgi:hypothetical protein